MVDTDGQPVALQSPLHLQVTPLPSARDVAEFQAALHTIMGVRSVELKWTEETTSAYAVDALNVERFLTGLFALQSFPVEDVRPAGGELLVQLAPRFVHGQLPAQAAPETAELPAAGETAALRPRPEAPPARSRAGWVWAGAALLLLVGAGIAAGVIIAQRGNHASPATPAAVLPSSGGTTVATATRPSPTTRPAVAASVAPAGRPSTPSASAPTAVAPTVAATVTAATPVVTAAPATASPTPTTAPASVASVTPAAVATTPVPVTTATDVLAALARQGLPIGAQSSDPTVADPEQLQGTAGAYTSRVVFQDSRLPIVGAPFALPNGGAVEVFAGEADAAARLRYLQRIAAVVPDMREYDQQSGRVLLRLSRRLSQEQATAYATALAAVPVSPP